jgi:hypothetical protein
VQLLSANACQPTFFSLLCSKLLSFPVVVSSIQFSAVLDSTSFDSWNVALVAYTPGGPTVHVNDLPLVGGSTGSFSTSTTPAIADLIGTDATVVAALVTAIDTTEQRDQYPTYQLRINGVLQPGGA